MGNNGHSKNLNVLTISFFSLLDYIIRANYNYRQNVKRINLCCTISQVAEKGWFISGITRKNQFLQDRMIRGQMANPMTQETFCNLHDWGHSSPPRNHNNLIGHVKDNLYNYREKNYLMMTNQRKYYP